MKVGEELESELLVEQLLICAYNLRDNISWPTLMSAFSAVNEVGAYLVERDKALVWTDACMQPALRQQVRP